MTDMLVKLYELPPLAPLVAEQEAAGIRIMRAMGANKQMVVDWVRANFGELWANECDVSFSHNPISCFLAVDDKQLIGFAVYDVSRKNFFGPTAVLEGYRGRSIGKVLLVACLQAMADAGYGYAIIGGAGPTGFYAKNVGAIPIKGSVPGIYKDLVGRELG
ncbi:MAG: GNAT family N-acetyltransferase [Chloroflexota bacterium]